MLSDHMAGIDFIRARCEINRNVDICPICRVTMERGSRPPFTPKDNTRTKMHLHYSLHPERDNKHWFYGCYRCNQDQFKSSLTEWFNHLRFRQDARCWHLLAVIKVLQRYGIAS